jgi:hypothetical protein
MGANDYLIPFGIDGKAFFEELTNIDAGLVETAENANQASKAMQKGFTDAAAAGEKLGTTIQTTTQKTAEMREQAKALGKDIGEALSGKTVGNNLEQKVKTFSDLLAKFSANANRPIKFNIDTAKLEQFERAIESGANELQILNQVIAEAKQQLATLQPNTQEFQALNAQIEIAEGFLEGLGNAANDVTVKNKSLKQELRELKAALAEMELQGQEGTQEFLQMSIRAGKLEDQIGDISQRIRVLASDTKFLDAGVQAIQGLAGAFAAAQGAAALFGSENKDVQQVIAKVTGAMALLQGIQAIAAATNKDSALSVLLFSSAQKGAVVSTTALAAAETGEAVAASAATTATRAFTAALLANPITAILVGLAALVTLLIAFTSGSDDAEEATKRLNEALEDQNKILELDESSLKRRTDLLVAQAKASGKAESDITTIEGQALVARLNLRRAAYNDFIQIYNNFDERRKLSAEDNKKLEDELIKRQQQIADDENAIAIKRIERDADRKKEAIALDKKAIEEAQKAAELRKKILEQQIKFTNELEKSRVDGLKDGYNKERAQAIQTIAAQIRELEAEKSLSAKAEKDKQALIKQLRENLRTQLAEIDRKQAQDEAALQLKAAQLAIQYREDGIVKEIETIRLGFLEKKREIEEQFKDEADTRQRLLDELNEAQIRETKKAQDEFTNKQIAAETERAVLEVETAKKFLPDLPGIEEQKQIAVLQVKLDFAKKSLDALLAQGNAENSTVVLQAKKQVQELQKQLGKAVQDAANNAPAINWFELLGLGDLTEEQRKAVTEAALKALDSIRDITGFIVDQYQRQIDKKQEVIDQIDNDISDLESQLDKEKSLREQGFANNVDIIEAELQEKKKAKDEEIKQQQELQAKQQQIQKLQLVLDTATQASNLVTAATSIFKALAGIPFIGIPLAIATIALMTGAFVAAKVKAFQAVNDQKQSFGGGGYIDGKSHTQGGRKYRAVDGGGLVELEGGEYVTNKRSTDKYSDLLEAINNDDISGMTEDGLKEMFADMGIEFSSKKPKEVINIVRQRDEYIHSAAMSGQSGADIGQDVKQINENVSFMAQRERDRVERWEDDKYYYEKFGNKTTQIKK